MWPQSYYDFTGWGLADWRLLFFVHCLLVWGGKLNLLFVLDSSNSSNFATPKLILMRVLRYVFPLFFLISIHFTIYSQSGVKQAEAKYVFLFIGDGMGLAEVNATEGYLAAIEGKTGLERLSFTRFPKVGLASTYSNDQFISCSAAAATALACGQKTNIGRIGMDPEGKNALESIAERAKKAGLKVGIVTSVSIDHATPAAFYAHQPDRNMYFEIGMELPESGFDFFAGGGFIKPDGAYEGKPLNLVQFAREKGYEVVDSRSGFENLSRESEKTLVLSPRQSSEASFPFAIDMDPGDITLQDYTRKAIEMLDNEKGFFLMVEGGKIDWANHANDAATLIQEVIAFDHAIAEAYQFYKDHPDETLIVVTADHETGGLALGNSATGYNSYLGILKYQKSSVEELNRITGQFRVNRSGDSEADFNRMLKVLESDLGLNSRMAGTLIDSSEINMLKILFNEEVYGVNPGASNYGLLMKEAVRMMNRKAGLGWTSGSHTGISVPVYSIGQGSELFSGYIDNTDIPKIMERLMGLIQ